MTAVVPLTHSQALVWVGQELAPDVPLYNMVWRFDLEGRLDADRFARAFEAAVRESDALSSVFRRGPNGPVQVPFRAHGVLSRHDLSNMADPEAAANDLIQSDARRPIDLATATFRGALLKLSADRWVWLLNQHHIATDAWSGALLFREVAARYDGAIQPPPPSFADYARKEAAARASGELDEARAYWRAQADQSAPGSPPYGARRTKGIATSHRHELELGPEWSNRLRTLAALPGFRAISPDIAVLGLLLTAYAAWLHRVTGDQTIHIGTPSHNRLTPDDKATIGLFVEMFPLTVQVGSGDTLRDLHRQVMTRLMQHLRHARPGASSVESASLFHAVLNYIPVRFGTFGDMPTRVRWLHPGAHDPAHDVRLHVYDFGQNDALTFEMDFNDAVFDPAASSRAAGHFGAVMEALLRDPDALIEGIGLTGPADGVPAPSVQIGLAHGALADSVVVTWARAASADDLAVICKGKQLTHAQLSAASAALASRLLAAGVGPGTRVLLHARRGIMFPAALLAIWRAGAEVVPLPADTPPERRAAILAQARPKAVIHDATIRVGDIAVGMALFDLDDRTTLEGPAADLPAVSGDAPAYTIFTSGSTGTPKGVTVNHAALAAYVDWAARVYGPAGKKTYAFHTSIGFDLTLTSLCVPLATGGTIRVYPEPDFGPDLAVIDVFAEDSVDVVKLTPAHLALTCTLPNPLGRIRTLILGGEALATHICRTACDRLSPELAIFNEYGPTEAVVGCMIHRFDPATDTAATVPIGRPGEGVRILLLDARDNPVPVGVTGEIVIGGTRLARGYLGDPDRTSARFTADPLLNGGRVYRTGDLARVRDDGVIEYLGRADTQLKISGVRIEPAEIEAALTAFPGIRHAHVAVIGPAAQGDTSVRCDRCALSSDTPGANIGSDGLCGICREFGAYRSRAYAYFDTPEALRAIVCDAAARRTGRHSAIMLLSGGKDSTYALYRLAELTPDVLALTLDNGFISETAKQNIRRVCAHLGIEHRFLTTGAMNAVFRDSLRRFSNVCQGCFKTIYSLALKVARDEGIPAIVTGLSRGQFFETRLTPELFRDGAPTKAEIEAVVHEARKAYHRTNDAVSRLLETPRFIDDALLDSVTFIDLYRYIDVPVQDIYSFLAERAPWIRPEDTGRSSNCLINDVGIWVHRRREGFHNYALPYSWDVRLGHKTRQEAITELEDEIDPEKVRSILRQIGADEGLADEPRDRLIAWVVADAEPDRTALQEHLRMRLPPEMRPEAVVTLAALPMTSNGKIEVKALPAPPWTAMHDMVQTVQHVLPESETERRLAELWAAEIGRGTIGVTEDFYELGGDSLSAIRIALAAQDIGLSLSPSAVFEHRTVRALAKSLCRTSDTNAGSSRDTPLLELDAAEMLAISRAIEGQKRS